MSIASKPESALIVGATGRTGSHLLQTLLSSSTFTRVGEYGRRTTESQDIPDALRSKLTQKSGVDFEKLSDGEWGAEKWDVVFITLGTKRAIAGSAANFEKIDREYVISAAKAAKSTDSSIQQRIVYLSSTGSNPTSSFLYPKSKGLTEEGLAKIGYSDTIIFRPAVLKGDKGSFVENVAGAVTGVLSNFTSTLEIKMPVLAQAMHNAGVLGSSALPSSAGPSQAGRQEKFTVIGNSGAIALAKEKV